MIDTCRIGESEPRLSAPPTSDRLRAIKSTSWRCFLALSRRQPRMFLRGCGQCNLVCRAHTTASRHVRLSARAHMCRYVHVCAQHTRIDADRRGSGRGTDPLRGRPGSCPTLSRYTIIFFVVCALVSPRERYRPDLFTPPSPPFCLLIGVAAVYFVLLLSASPRPSWTLSTP